MKKLLSTIMMLVLSCSISFAAAQSPFFTKGEYFGKKVISILLDDIDDDAEAQSHDFYYEMHAYLYNNLTCKEQFQDFFKGFETGIYAKCEDDYGLTKNETNLLIDVDDLVEGISSPFYEEFESRF